MTYKQIETSREIRLWASQVLIPAGLLIFGLSKPEVRKDISDVWTGIKTKAKERLSR